MGISTTSFGIIHENERFSKSATCGVHEVINSVTSSFLHAGVNISFSGRSLTVAGRYTNLYSPATWTYIPVDKPDTVTVRNFELIPQKIGTVISGNKDPGSTVAMAFTVNTTETVTTTSTQTGYNSVTDPVTGVVTQVPYTYQQTDTTYVDHSYTITQKISNIWDDFATQLSLAVSRSEY